MKTYLLPCACSALIPVGTGQAGGRVVCPACGAAADVPKLRELGRLEERAPAGKADRGSWSLAHSMALAGAAIAILSLIGLALIGSSRPAAAVAPETLRAAVLAAGDNEIFEAWRKLSQAGVERTPSVEERNLQRWTIFSRGISRGLMVLGGLGGALAAAGGAMLYSAGAGTASSGSVKPLPIARPGGRSR